MSSKCPPAPADANPLLNLQTTSLKKGTEVFRFHGAAPRRANSADTFNPNTGRRIDIPEDGARFNPFPGAPALNVPTLYAADNLEAAALESVFHDIEHVPNPTYPVIRLKDWRYSRLVVRRDLVLFRLTNPQLRQLPVRRRRHSIQEQELVHTPPDQYPNTRTWARFLHDSALQLHGLAWRPRLGGAGLAFVFFGDRCGASAIAALGQPIPVARGTGFRQLQRIAATASIRLIEGR